MPIEVVSQRNRCLRANIEGVSDPYKGCRSGTIAGRMACVLVAALLACASSVHGQIVEEGGFPVKGGGVSGESFSLSCPPRLYVEAGESVLLSCSATAVPEEGVRYEWESLSGDGLHLLSNANERSPLFTAPVSEAGGEYVYRLTAMSVGVYETATATVTVMARGVSGGSVQGGGKLPVAQEDCDSFGALEGFREGCATEDKMPPSFEPFEDGLEGEGGPGFLSPEEPGLPDRPSGPVRSGGLGPQTPPYLDCPAAVFLEELETGSIECHAWDASGEEYLEYSWEPVGSTTRDYLENPRLIPEDAPNPSVVAPEAPVYETLESFHSGETTFRYRYRLTATSRATGLSSSSEVEVFVSSTRPSVYCPLEVVVEEGSTVALDCEGVDPLSARMDYDEEEASVLWEWEGLWGTSMAPLAATDLSSPLFTAPAGSAGEEYHYIASMMSSASGAPRTARRRVTVRVTVRVTEAEEGEQAAGDASALAYKGAVPVVTCNDSEVYEATDDFTLDCSVTDEPTGATYNWTSSVAGLILLSSTTILKPTFYVPGDIDQRYTPNKSYLYKVTMTADGIDGVTDVVGVKVLEKPDIWCQLFRPSWWLVNEGSQDFALEHCNSSVGWDLSYLGMNTPFFDPVNPLSYEWTPRGSTSDTNLLSVTNIESPTFFVPDDVSGDKTFEYLLTVSAENADPYRRAFEVTVRDTEPPSITCVDTKMYEATADITLDCTVTKGPSDAAYSWAARGSTSDTNKLSSTTMLAPTFYVPHNISEPYSRNKHYAYTVTLSASGIADVTEDVKVTVLEKPDVRCNLYIPLNKVQVNEGSEDFVLRYCSHTSRWGLRPFIIPEPPLRYEWTPQGSTPDTNLLSATAIELPTFFVPDDVSGDKTFHYLMTVSAENADPWYAYANVTVRDTDPPPPSITCVDTEVYEGASDITLDCTVENEPANATYSWTGTDISNRLSGIGSRTPTFAVPDNVNRDTDYDYTVTLSAVGVDDVTEVITVTVLNKEALSVVCTDAFPEVYEGSSDITLDCSASGAPSGFEYAYVWEARGDTPDTALLSATDIASPVFAVPEEVDEDETYEYMLTVSADNTEGATANVTVRVLDKKPLNVACATPSSVYEGSADIAFDCSASGAPEGSSYSYRWMASGDTQDTSLLSAADIASPTFYVPDEVAANETYGYLLTVSAANAESSSAAVSVTVLNVGALRVVCASPASVYEGSADFALDCLASGAPSGSTYEYVWTARGDTQDTVLLSATNVASPVFFVPEEVDEDETYAYLLTVSSANAESSSARVSVTVLNKGALAVACVDPGSVYEGSEDIAFDCSASGAPGDNSQYAYAWTARGATANTDLLTGTDGPAPTFAVPDEVEEDETYEYLLTVIAENAESGSAEVSVTVLNEGALAVACADPGSVYEGSEDVAFDCSASGAPGGSPQYAYAWTARGDTQDTSLLSAADIAAPTFHVPEEVAEDETYEYLLTVSATNAEDAMAEVAVTVLNKGALAVACADPGSVYEGSEDIAFDCSASGAPDDSPQYAHVWTARGDTPDVSLLSAADIASPLFYVPDEVASTTTYEYLLTVIAENAESGSAEVSVTVLNEGALAVACADPGSVYEGSEDVAFDCSASGAPGGSPQYAYAWTARGDTQDTSLLSAADIAAPTFHVPEEVAEDETYEYLLTVSATNAEDAMAEVAVTVLNKGALAVACADPGSVYEGSEDIAFDCSASGAPDDSPQYAHVWTARGDTPDVSLLSAADIASPLFYVPDEVASTTTYEYLLTVIAENAESGSAEVSVTVLNEGALAVACADPGSVYEGSEDVAFDCSASGAPGGSPQYAYAWTARGDTQDTSLLSAADIAAPTFHVPEEVAEDETYEYLLTVSATNAEDAMAEVAVTVLNKGALAVACAAPGSVYEGSEDIAFDCSASGAPDDSPQYAHVWTARGDTPDVSLLSAADIASPLFYVPDEVASTTTYEYLLTVIAENAESGSAEVSVTVLNEGALAVACADPGSVYEGSEDVAFDCSASGAPGGSPQYAYAWTARGDTQDTSLLSAADIAAPTFHVPEEVAEDETYEYLLTVSATNAEDAMAEVAVTVLNKGALAVACAAPGSVYEGSEDIAFDCSASGAPDDSPQYAHVWTARGDTPDVSLLSAADIASPLFYVPDEVASTTTYEYLLTVIAENAESGSAEVSVTVLNEGALAVACADPGSVYEGSEDVAFDCSASGAPGGSPQYAYAWTARGDTQDTSLLSAADIAAPTFHVPEEVAEDETYEYLLTVSATNAEDAMAEVAVTVLNKGALAVACAAPGSVYEGSEDIAFDCSASGAPDDSPQYAHVWTARGDTQDTSLLSAADIASPLFYVPDEVASTTTYEYLLTVSAENAESGSAEVSVTVLNEGALAVACAAPGSVYEGSEDFALDCSASGAPVGSAYEYAWTARGSTANTAQLSAADIASPLFYVPDEVASTTTYEYLLTVIAENAESGSAEVSVTVLNEGALAVACAAPGSVYEGSEDIAFDCSASGASGDNPQYTYVWTARGDTQDTSLLSAADIAAPTFHVPEEVDEDETYEYLLTVSATNAEDAMAEVSVTVLDRAVAPPSDPVSPPLASSSAREPSDPSSLGVTASASPLRFGVQSAETQASLDPVTDRILTHVSGPYHAGRMTLSLDGSEALDENGEMALSIELASPVVLRREGGIEDASIVLAPQWSLAESCEQLSSQAIGSLYTEVTLSEEACRLLRFGGELDLTGVLSGQYTGSLDILLRSGESEETHSVDVDVTVVPAQRVITIGPGGVRFSTSRELPAGLTEEQNLSIYPDVAFLTEEKPHGVFELSNPSLIPLEISVSARFGYTEATENGREVVVEDVSESHLGDLSQVVDIHPGVLVLMPGEKGLVRYGMQEGALAAMAEKGYAAFFDVVSEPRQYVRTDQMPEEVTGDRTARVTMRVPGVYVPGEGASQLRATLLSISFVGPMSATFLLETQDHPFAGEVVAYDGDGRELGRRETLVYTRSRVRIPLDRMPEEGTVFLRFMPRGSGRVPEPASVEWDAPRRNIGEAEDKARATTTETLARKP